MSEATENGNDGEATETAKVMSEATETKLVLAALKNFGAPVGVISEIITNNLKLWQWKNLIKLGESSEKFLAKRGIKSKINPIPLKVLIPALGAASLEDDDDLRDLWAQLLVNAADPDGVVQIGRGIVSVLRDFNPMEARLLQAIYSAPPMESGVPTKGLPDKYVQPEETEEGSDLPPEPVQIGLWHLKRLGCIYEAGTWDSITGIRRVKITALGKALIEACTAPPKKD